jgi:single-stranded-DNA-specific exonuclease
LKRWRTAPSDPEAARQLAVESGVPAPVAEILLRRGHTTAGQVERFVHPRLSDLSDPGLLPDMEPAVDRIHHALRNGERITVFGDYDVDGITSAVLLSRTLRTLGGHVSTFLPHREDDGYGLHPATLDRCMEAQKPDLLLTVDCGSSSVEAVRSAAARGVDVVITDHHALPDELAPARAVINPKRSPDGSPWSGLCGVGVVFKLCHALVKAGRRSGSSAAADLDLREGLGLVALGTVADVVPLTGENRTLVRHGLVSLQTTENPGLKALMQSAGISGEIEAYHVSYLLAPRLNAAGRLGTAERAMELLSTEDPVRAEALAGELERSNQERREIEKAAYEEAEQQVDSAFDPDRDFGLVVYSEGWHPGVIGIVASRLVSKFHRPVIVVTTQKNGRTRGSGRSVEGFNLVEALEACSDTLLRHGGHPMAAGVEIDKDRIGEFRERFSAVAADRLRGSDLLPVQPVDGWLNLSDVDESLMLAVESMRPFGMGNPSPVWASSRLTVLGRPRIIGERHLTLTFLEGMDQREAIGFRMADRVPLPPGLMDAAYTVQRKEWRGRKTLQMVLQDFRPGTEAPVSE